MKLSTLLLGAAFAGLLSTSFALADDFLGGAVKSASVGGKQILTDSRGMTLYIWDKDTAGVSNCGDRCALVWPPMLVDASTAASGDFTFVGSGDGAKKMVAYKGKPLYHFSKDTKPGDIKGDGVSGTWHIAIE